MKHHFAIARPP
jgi:hypothetical protein